MTFVPPFACVFDAYGTLFDIHTSMKNILSSLGEKATSFAKLWETRQHEYSWQRSLMNQYVDFWQIIGEALDFTMDTFKIKDSLLRSRLMELYLNLQPYPDVYTTLEQLKNQGIKTLILSNGSNSMLVAVVNTSGLRPVVDSILSVDQVGIYKPHPKVYHYALEYLACEKEKIVFVSSTGWDIAGSINFGFKGVWLNRYSHSPERLSIKPHYEVQNLKEFYNLFNF